MLAIEKTRRAEYRTFAENVWDLMQSLGAIGHCENWSVDIPEGEQTSMHMAVKARDDEDIVFSWTTWPDKYTRDAAWERILTEPELGARLDNLPFDGKRLIHGGFEEIFRARKED